LSDFLSLIVLPLFAKIELFLRLEFGG